MSRRGRAGFLSRRTLSAPTIPRDPKAALTALASTTFTWDLATDALSWGPNAAEVLGVPHIGLFSTGAAFAEAVEPGSGSDRPEALESADGPDEGLGVPYTARYALRIKTDRLVLVDETGRWYADAAGHPALARGMLRVSTAASEHTTLAAGLKARAALLAQIVDDVVAAQRSRHAMTLIVGTWEGGEEDPDTTTAEIARRVRPLMRRHDRFMIYGPNRFALALASCPASEAEGAVRRILVMLGDPDFGPVRRPRLGAASAPDHALDAPELLRRAEEALASALAGGPAGFVIYSPRRTENAGRPAVGTDSLALLEALNERRLLPCRHPVVDARTRGMMFAEALPRLGSPEGNVLAAGDLRQMAERDGMSLLLDARMLELAADALAACAEERISLTISRETLRSGEWLGILAAHLGSRPGIESRLVIDVPEAALAEPAMRGRLDAMKALGVATMLSGFGTGQASVKHLRSVALDMIKLDGAFVQALPLSVDNRQHVRGLIDLAHHFGILIVAEWVDDEPTARLLAAWGIDCLQGGISGLPFVAADPGAARMRTAGMS